MNRWSKQLLKLKKLRFDEENPVYQVKLLFVTYFIEKHFSDYITDYFSTALQQPQPPKTITLMLKIDKYDVILVETLDNENCLSLILNNEISMKVRVHDDKQIIQGEINNFNLYLSEFAKERRALTRHEIIEKCNISLNGSTPEDKGLQVNIMTSKIRVHVSPGTIELINKIMATMTQPERDVSLVEKAPPDYSSLWEAQEFLETDHWFIRCDEAVDALSMDSLAVQPIAKDELCMIDVPAITIVIENGVGIHTIPMLIIETSMDGRIKNWSSEMEIESSLRLTMFYYNNTLALWEPLIEPVEVENKFGLLEYIPWELNFGMRVDKHLDDEQDEPTTSIGIKSQQTLELTVTKTCLDVLTSLGNEFSKAIEKVCNIFGIIFNKLIYFNLQ